MIPRIDEYYCGWGEQRLPNWDLATHTLHSRQLVTISNTTTLKALALVGD